MQEIIMFWVPDRGQNGSPLSVPPSQVSDIINLACQLTNLTDFRLKEQRISGQTTRTKYEAKENLDITTEDRAIWFVCPNV